MYVKLFKIISIIFLLILFPIPQNSIAQTNAENIIKRYEGNNLRDPSSLERQIIHNYLESTKNKSPHFQERVFNPDAVIYISEDFSTSAGTTPPTGWVQNLIIGDPGFDLWHFDNPGGRTLNAPINNPAAIFDSYYYSSGGNAEDVALESPTFTATGTSVFLDWNQYFHEGFGGEIFAEAWDGTSWQPVYGNDSETPDPDFQSIDISGLVVGVTNAKVRFRWTGDNSWWWIVDNVYVYEPDPIPSPAILVSPENGGINLLPTTTLNWTAGGGYAPTGYYIYFGTDGDGDDPPTNIENGTDLGLITTYTPNPALLPDTNYYWTIVPYNENGNAIGTPIWNFTAGPDPTITTFPYTENFDGVTPPDIPYGWSVENTNSDGYTWSTYAFQNLSPPNDMCIRYSYMAMDDWFYSPPINLTGGVSYTIKFYYRSQSGFESLEVRWGNEPSSSGMIGGQIFDNPSFSSSSYLEGSGTITPSTTGIYYIGWHGYSIAEQWRIYVDDISIEEENNSAAFQLTVGIEDKWNMVSVPGIHPTDQNVGTWWTGMVPGSVVYRFLPTGYDPATVASPGIGYWMKNNGVQTYNTGDEWPEGGILYVPYDPIAVSAGWNMIGGYDFNVPVPGGISPIPVGTVYGFSNSSGYLPVTEMVAGYGYWAKFASTGQINLTDAPIKGLAKEDDLNKNWGYIVITDNEGRNYTLYISPGDVELNNFDLPPIPPIGLFDIRFGSGRFVEDLGSGQQTIEMQGVEYPVRLLVQGMKIKIQDVSGKIVNENLQSGQDVVISNNSINKLLIVSGELTTPSEYLLEQNYPNPFNPSTTINFSLPEASQVTLNIYNILGEQVDQLVNQKLEPGRYSYDWDAGSAAAGLYIYEFRTAGFVSTKKMLLIK